MHGNSKTNPNPHLLYGIFEEKTDIVFKYGITDDPVRENGLPARARKQLVILNLAAGYHKFTCRIILMDIPGRAEAERVERQYINEYTDKFVVPPAGNLR